MRFAVDQILESSQSTRNSMFKSDLKAHMVSSKTAFRCFGRIFKLQEGDRADALDRDLCKNTISLGQVIDFGQKRGITLRPKSLNWSRLQVAISTAPVMLRLTNGNMIVAMRKEQPGLEDIVVTDPLYKGGECFLLPREALENVWAGDALIIEPRQSKIDSAVTGLLWVLSICGFVAGAFMLFRVGRELIARVGYHM